MDARPRALVVSGSGRYADPWHDFAETSGALAALLGSGGFLVETREDVDGALAALDDRVDLLAVNVGDPSRGEPVPAPVAAAARAGLLGHLARGGPVLALHASTLLDVPEWEDVVGGRWVDGVSMHPDLGLARVRVRPERHPVVAQAPEHVELYDERYAHLRVAGDVVALASHEHDGLEHPLLWARRYGRSRVVYDALGHDRRSYESPDHRAILARAARWLVGDLP